MLSKSKYTRGTNCEKSLWLYVHKKDEQVYSESTMAIYARGTNAGELAQEYFPDGKMAVLEDYPGYASAKRTQDFINEGVETIYEATFIYDNTLVAVDILHKSEGKWYLYEVKSTNSVNWEHIKDVAVQYYVVSGSGLDLADAFLMHFDREYVRRGEIEVQKLFKAESILNDILPLQNDVKTKIPELLSMIEGVEPVIEMGGQCSSPYECDFKEYCSKLRPEKAQEEIVELSNEPELLVEEIRDFVKNLQYPICHLDFETIRAGVPLFNESRPYQQIPFQYSLHFQESKDSEIIHTAYLAENDLSIDPRPALIEKMIAETKTAKTILVYSIAFERTRINEMIIDFPQYKTGLESIVERLDDLMIPFQRKYYHTESMGRRYSIKVVLPILCPEISYYDLEISNGMEASNSFLELYYCKDENIIAETRQHLLKYCHLDTLAMVKVLEVLQKVE